MALLSHFLLLLFLSTVSAQSSDPSGVFCNTNNNITTTQQSKNIDTLLPQLVSATIQNGFITTSTGKAKDLVYGLAQCRADVPAKECSVCIQDAAREVRKRCPNQADSRIWYEYCFLRYDTENFIGQLDTGFSVLYANVENVTDPKRFAKELEDLTGKITSQAVASGSKGNGKGKSKLASFMTIYALVQCTRDLEPLVCKRCLAIAFSNFSGFCNNKRGCRVLYSSCFVRYEVYPFYFPLESSDTTSSTATYMVKVSKG